MAVITVLLRQLPDGGLLTSKPFTPAVVSRLLLARGTQETHAAKIGRELRPAPVMQKPPNPQLEIALFQEPGEAKAKISLLVDALVLLTKKASRRRSFVEFRDYPLREFPYAGSSFN